MRRSQPDTTDLGEADDLSFQEEGLVRRFPRIGAQFQTRISKSTGYTIRPTPERMSVDFPYISEKEAGELDQVQSNGVIESKVGPAATKSGFDLMMNNYSKSSRGGILVYKPAKETGEFLKYVQPFVMSTRNQVKPTISNEAWIQHMIHLHSTETTGKRNRACRGGVKRKRAENEEMIWNLENILSNIQKSRKNSPRPEMLGEEEAIALEHLRLFDGNINAAEFDLLVKFSGGQALKMRKREERERTKRKLKVPSQQTSESWRDMYQSSTLPYRRSVLGQLQDDAKPLYVMQMNASQTLGDKLDEHTNVNLVMEPDDSKGAWRSILACAKSIERQLNRESFEPGDKKPLLSTLLTFVGKAYDLPTPESCFGTHHVMIEEVSNTIISILNHVKKAQNVHAKIRDKIFNESEGGINSDDLLKFLDTEYSGLPIRLQEVDKLYQFRNIVVQWEARLLQVLSVTEEELEHENTKNYLRIAEQMQHEATSHGYRSKALVQLTTRINKAYDLRDRILKWKYAGVHGKVTTIRTVSGFVKEAKRIKLFSPEVVEIFEYHRLAEEWIDRANIAIRSKMSLPELKNLIERGEEMSLDLSEYIDKLRTRVRIADDWLDALDEIVPFKNNECTSLEIWQNLETALKNGNHNGLHDLSSEGNRIPVDVVAVKLLQFALDAKNWTTKALKWIPDNSDSRKGKLCDLRDHLDKISSLRDKLPLSEIERNEWKPAGECELAAIILAADSWVDKYKAYLTGDNRKSDRRSCISIAKLRTIVDEGNVIYANIGNSISKISRILVQAESWYSSHLSLLQHCGISSKDDVIESSPKPFITIQEMSAAVEAARIDVSLDLDEAMELRKILDRSSSWNERVSLIAPKRNKRHSRGSRPKFRLEDLISLIEEASNLPIDTNESVNRLQIQLNDVEIWRSEASKALKDIIVEFTGLKSHVTDVYGEAKDYSIERISDGDDSDGERVGDQRGLSPSIRLNTDAKDHGEKIENIGDNNAELVVEPVLGAEEDVPGGNRGSNSALTVFRLIKELKEETRDISVITVEGEIGELLDTVSKWCIKSFKYLSTPREVFDKRFFGAFDRFIVEGEGLCGSSCNCEPNSNSSDELNERLFDAWGSVVKDQLTRLTILKREREKFEAWCKRASQILSDEKKLTAEKLADLAKSSRHFPANRDLVSKIRGLSVKVSKWTEKVQKLFESGERIDAQDARILVETGEKLKVQTEELKRLRAEIRAARNWSNRAKKCNVEQGSIHVNDVKQLVDEHDSLLIEMPDELEALKEATIGYCICRRPYEGFMIGCDHCEEWYHGSCIGISESKADRVEKFTCVRCSTKIILNSSATTAVGIVRKWTCPKDFKKARQIDFQKFQRKDRKEKKDIEKFSNQIKKLQDQLSDSKTNLARSKENDTASMEPDVATPGDNSRDCMKKKADITANQSDDPSANSPSVENGEPANATNDGNLLTSDETKTGVATKNPEEIAPKVHEKENVKGDESKTGFCSSSDVSKTNTSGTSGLNLSEAEILTKIDRAKASLELSKDRLMKIANQSEQRTLDEAEEDKYAKSLRYWCLKVRSEVLAPAVDDQAETARPLTSGCMSPAMKDIIAEADTLGILDLSDVRKMVACFKSMCWSFSAMGVLRYKPCISEVRHLVSEASKFKLPDEKALRTLKFMTTKASQLQSKVQKALKSKKAVSKPGNISFLRDLKSGIRESPLVIPEEEILRIVIEDGNLSDRKLLDSRLEELEVLHCKSIHLKENASPHAPNPIELWPPFGLQNSEAAIQAFGSECLAIPAVIISDVEGTASQMNEAVSRCPSSSKTIPEGKATEQDEELSISNRSTTLLTAKSTVEATPYHGTSQPEKTSSFVVASNDSSIEFTEKCDSGIQNGILKNGSSSLKLESKSAQPRHERIPNPEISHESCQRTAGPSVPTVTSNALCLDQPKRQPKDENPTTAGTSILTMISNNRTCQSHLESNPEDKTIDTPLSTDTSKRSCYVELDTHPKDATGTVNPSVPSDKMKSACDSKVGSHLEHGTTTLSSSVPTDKSSRVSHQKHEAGTVDPLISTDASIIVCDSKIDSPPKSETRILDQSILNDASNVVCDPNQETQPKRETGTVQLPIPTVPFNSVCDSKLGGHSKRENRPIDSSIPTDASDRLCDRVLARHHNDGAHDIPSSPPSDTSNRISDNNLFPISGNGTVEKSIPASGTCDSEFERNPRNEAVKIGGISSPNEINTARIKSKSQQRNETAEPMRPNEATKLSCPTKLEYRPKKKIKKSPENEDNASQMP